MHSNGAGAKSSDSTLAEGRATNDSSSAAGKQISGNSPAYGRAALDAATRITLFCGSSGNTLLTCLPGEGCLFIPPKDP